MMTAVPVFTLTCYSEETHGPHLWLMWDHQRDKYKAVVVECPGSLDE